MTLNKEFLDLAFLKITSEELADKSVQVTEDFAIGFAEWRVNDWVHDERWTKISDTKELLEIYKQEKGL
jgi:hypothetical protein